MHQQIVSQIIEICRDLAPNEQFADVFCQTIQSQLALMTAERCLKIRDMLCAMLKYEAYLEHKAMDDQSKEQDASRYACSSEHTDESMALTAGREGTNRNGSPKHEDFNTFMSISSVDSLRRIERNRNA